MAIYQFLFLLIIPISMTVAGKQSYPEIIGCDYCEYQNVENPYNEYKCPSLENPLFTIHAFESLDQPLKLFCDNSAQWSDFRSISYLRNPNYFHLSINNCPRMTERTITSILLQLIIHDLRALSINNTSIDFPCTNEVNTPFFKIWKLHLENIFHTDIHEEFFINFPEVYSLSIKGSNFGNYTNSLMKQVRNMRQLSLANDHIDYLDSEMFENLRGLYDLDLSGNNILKLENGVFDNLRNLRKLNLNGNEIREIGAEVFRILEDLEELDLRNNNFTRLPGNLFPNNRKLRKLHISDAVSTLPMLNL